MEETLDWKAGQTMGEKFRDWLILLRPHQWVKNSLVFAGYIFAGNFKLLPQKAISDLVLVLLAFLSFCLLSGAVYAINDVVDREKDQQHPIKRNRPVASGRVSEKEALMLAAASTSVGLILAGLVSFQNEALLFFLVTVCYLIWGGIYSFCLKRFIIVDALGVAGGFVLRVIAGCLAIKVDISPWLILCTLLLSLFIAFAKRRHELILMSNNATSVRSVLGDYSPELLDMFISVTASMTIMAYSLYTFTAPHILLGDKKEPWLMVTIPFVVYGVLRFLYLAYQTDIAGAPEQMFRDKPFIVNLVLWALTILMLGWFAR